MVTGSLGTLLFTSMGSAPKEISISLWPILPHCLHLHYSWYDHDCLLLPPMSWDICLHKQSQLYPLFILIWLLSLTIIWITVPANSQLFRTLEWQAGWEWAEQPPVGRREQQCPCHLCLSAYQSASLSRLSLATRTDEVYAYGNR
jgi:hypothetical protein